ncbi:MAG TPA: DUF4185 domain-containing protein [Pseudomonadales bacterium]
MTLPNGTERALADAPVGNAPVRVGASEKLAALTGPESSNATADRWGIHGADLGHMFWHRGKLHMVFGDTFGYPGLGGRNWRSNTMAVIADPDPASGLPFEAMITGDNGLAKELIPSKKVDRVEKTVIPTYGVSTGGRMVLHYMSVRQWGKHGVWEVGHSGLAYSDDDGATWHTPASAVWPRGSGFEQVAFVKHDGWIYSFGIGEGRWSGVRLRRVAPEHILERDAYQYWSGSEWSGAIEAATPVVPAPAGELSVAYSERHRRWLMMYLHPQRKAIVLRTAPELTGPWSAEQPVVTAREYPGLYAPYIVPGAAIDGELYYTMSLWGAYNVFLMRTKLQWGDEPALPTVGAAATDEGSAAGASP